MRSDTQSVTIATTPEEVIDFVADPENLPKWATGFAQSIRRENDHWMVTTPQGDVTVQIETDPDRGIVDYVMSPAPGVTLTLTAYSRVLPNEDGAEYVFTQFQAPVACPMRCSRVRSRPWVRSSTCSRASRMTSPMVSRTPISASRRRLICSPRR